ncbi:MAG: NAD-dependent epimerase/dehydratase family protein, partial [Proteobacteria bacterium]|nr:NAD-dependent epimerase/dehydratase family protein [Pseudomonadota bacterium]
MDTHRIYLVTGAAGEVGLQVTSALCAQGFKTRAMVRATSDRAELSKLPVEIVEADLTDQRSLERVFKGVEGVFHIAAVYRESGLSDETFFEVNTKGTQRVFDAAVVSGVKRVIHCSTGGVLGDIQNPPGSHLTPYNPGDVYQRSKVEGEKIALENYRSGRMRGAIIRPAMVYGPGDTRHLKLFRMIARGRFFYVGAGNKYVHFIDIRDLARAFLLAMEHEEINGEIYHIAGG